MRSSALLLLAMLIVVFATIQVSPAQSVTLGDFLVSDVSWSDSTGPQEVGPGSLNAPLTITLLHTGDVALRAGRVELLLPNGFESVDGGGNPVGYIPSTQPGQTVTLTFRLNIGESVNLGTHYIRVMIYGTRTDDTDFSASISLPVRVLGTTDIRVESVGAAVVAGRLNELEVTVSNLGTGKAHDVKLEISSAQQLGIIDRVIEIGDLESQGRVALRMRVYVPPSLAGSLASFTVSITYLDSYLNRRTVTRVLDLSVEYPRVPNLLIEPTTSTLVMGSVNDLVLRFSNAGSSSVRDVTVLISISAPLVIIGSDGRFHIDSINVGESRTIPLRLYLVEMTTSSVPVTLSLSYVDENNQLRTETRTLMFFVSAQPGELLSPIQVSISPNVVYSGMVDNVTLRVRNVGNSELRAVTLNLLQSGTATWVSDTSLSIESLKPGEERDFSVVLYVPSDSPTAITLSIQVSYFDPDNIQKSEDRQVGLLVKGVRRFEVVDYTVLPERPSPGGTFSVTLILVNTGTAKAMAASVSVDSASGVRVFGQSRTFLGDIAINTPTSVTFTFVAPNMTRPGPLQIPINVNYRDEMGEQHVERLTITVPIGGGAGQFGGAFTRQAAQGETSMPSNPFGLIILPLAMLAGGLVAGFAIGRKVRTGR